MKIILCIILLFACKQSYSQQFLNGSFELNYLRDCDSLNLSNFQYNSLLDSIYGIGRLQSLDLQTDSCSMNIIYTTVDGHFYGSLETGAQDTNSTAISFLLSLPLIAHNTYVISFYSRSIRNISMFDPIKLIIGYSQNDSTFGAPVDTTGVPDTLWTKRFAFLTPDTDAQYITVMGLGGILNQYTIVDDFSFDTTGLYLTSGNFQKEFIELFPNPCNDELNVRLQEGGYIFIMNSLGQIVYEKIIPAGVSITKLDLKEFPNGIYFLQIVNENWIHTKNIIKY